MHNSGNGLAQTDIILLEAMVRSLKKSPHLLANVVSKEQEFLRVGRDFKGRQAILMAREYCEASRSDRKRLDRAKIDNTTLVNDDVV